MVTLSWRGGRLRVKVIGLLLQSLQHISVKPHNDAADGGEGGGEVGGFMHYSNWEEGSSLRQRLLFGGLDDAARAPISLPSLSWAGKQWLEGKE